jgi:glycerol-3-phosphate dehydrogenase (NAD(P)+)
MGQLTLSVLGAGAWGTALAISLAARHRVRLWARRPEHAAAMRLAGENRDYLPGYPFPAAIDLTDDLRTATRDSALLIAAVPSGGFRSLLAQLDTLGPRQPLIWVCKGFETGRQRLLHQVANDVWPGHAAFGVLSGPSFAQEVAAGLPTALTLAAHDAAFAHHWADKLHGERLRIYTSSDLVGVEIGGAVKNVMAIAAGICDGLGFGLNARAALVTRALAEMTRLGLALGARAETFMGLSGMGDLLLTATGDLSRNRRVGLRLADGATLDTILRELGHIAEGVNSAREVNALATRIGVDMPITRMVCRILFDGLPAHDAVSTLLGRELKAEF